MSNSLYKENGYYSVLREGAIDRGSPASLRSNNLQNPVNIYKLEGDVIRNVDKFQKKYARFLQCSSSSPGADDINKRVNCDDKNDGINSLDSAYQNVMYSINSFNRGLKNIDPASSSGLTNKEYEESKTEMDVTYREIEELRKKLDIKLGALYNEQKNGRESSAAQLDSTVYANTLWTILATCLLYYIIVEL